MNDSAIDAIDTEIAACKKRIEALERARKELAPEIREAPEPKVVHGKSAELVLEYLEGVDGGRTVDEITQALPVSRATVNNALKELAAQGKVSKAPSARTRPGSPGRVPFAFYVGDVPRDASTPTDQIKILDTLRAALRAAPVP